MMRGWLKDLRKRKRLSQADVARGLLVSQNYYSDIENSMRQKPMTVLMARKIAEFFAVPVEEVIKSECDGERTEVTA